MGPETTALVIGGMLGASTVPALSAFLRWVAKGLAYSPPPPHRTEPMEPRRLH